MDLAEERERLAAFLGYQADFLGQVASLSEGEFDALMREWMGVGRWDQYRAATAEAERQVAGGEPVTGSQATTGKQAAGILRCLAGSSCPHAVKGDRPLYAFLAVRVITCQPCAGRYVGRLAAHDRRVLAGQDDGLCDYCLEEADHFRFEITTYGPAVLYADVCDGCLTEAGYSE